MFRWNQITLIDRYLCGSHLHFPKMLQTTIVMKSIFLSMESGVRIRLFNLNACTWRTWEKAHDKNSLTIQARATFYICIHMEIPIKASLSLAWELPCYRYMTVIFTRVHFQLQNAGLCLRMWIKYTNDWKRKEAALSASHITETQTSFLRPNCPSPAAPKVVILTTPVQPMMKI